MASPDDFPAMIDHLRKDFSQDEPTSGCFNASQSIVEGNAEYGRVGLTPNNCLSLAAYDDATGNLAAVRISRVLHKEQALGDSHSIDEYYGDYLPVIDIMAQLDQMVKPNIFDKYGVDRVLEFRVLSVGSKYRQRGLAFEMCLRSLRLAKQKGIPLVIAYFTSNFSKRVGEKLGFTLESEIMYEDYKFNGELAFKHMGNHKACTLMSKKV